MPGEDQLRLRSTFDEIPELYDRVRPCYPAKLFDDLAEVTGIGPASRVLEIGCGTGKATVPLARRGAEIVAVELGPGLAAVARRNLAGFPRVRVEVAAFEDWALPREPFDAVLAATAFHWIDPAVRVAKTAEALRNGGWLATITTHHVTDGHEQFFADVVRCYDRWEPATHPDHRMPASAEIPLGTAELAGCEQFGSPIILRYLHTVTYSTEEFLDLTRTFSTYLAANPAAQAGLLDCLADLVDTHYAGQVVKPYLMELCLARCLC